MADIFGNGNSSPGSIQSAEIIEHLSGQKNEG
jgi:hypothetical protein